MRKHNLILIGLLILQLVGCTRASKDDSSKVSIYLQSSVDGNNSSALPATLLLSHASINVTGTGITNPIVRNWDSCHDCPTATALPDLLSIDVPSGTGRFIQILAVYKDSGTGQMVFYYGDSTVDLTTDNMTLEIPVSRVGQGNITSGRVSGRYFTTPTEGPTGLIDIKYSPGGGKTALIVDHGSIVNGWFSVFMLSGANLQYVVRSTGELLWGQEMSFESAALNPAENSGAYFDQRVRAFLPVHIRVQNNNNTLSYSNEEAETFVWGYWGPGAIGKKVCTSGLDSSPVPQKIKSYVTSNYASAPTLTVSHLSNYNLAVPTKAVLTDTVSTYKTIVVQGGASMTSACGSFPDTAANQFLNFQKVSLELFDGNGNDSVAGFRGIFRGGANNNFVTVSNSDPKVIAGQALPGVEAVFDGLRLFKRLGSEDFHLETPNCADIAAGAMNFTSGSVTDAAIDAAGNFSQPTTISTADGNNGVSAVICPVKNGALAPMGDFLGKWVFGNSGVNIVGGPATQIQVSKNNSPINFASTNQCFDISVDFRDANGMPAIGSASPTSYSLLPNNTAGVVFYGSYNDCSAYTNALNPATLVMPANQNNMQIYVKSTTAYPSFQIDPASAGLTPTPLALALESSGNYIRLELPQSMVPNLCYSGKAVYSYLSGGPASAPGNVTVTLTGSANLGFYSDATCSAATPSTTILNGATDTTIYVKVTGSPNGPINTSTTASGVLNADYRFYQGSGNATPAALMVSAPSSFYSGNCTGPMEVNLVNANNTVVPATGSTLANLSSTLPAIFYSDSSCSASVNSMTLATNQYKTMFWAKVDVGGPTVFSASASGLASANYPIAVSGLNRFDLSIEGGANPSAHGQCVRLEIQPLTYPTNSIGSFPMTPITLNFTNFPASSLFKSRAGTECAEPLVGNSLSLPSYASAPQYIYFLATNGTASSLNLTGSNMHVEAPPYASGTALSLIVNTAPNMVLADTSSGDASVEFPFQIMDILQRFTGIPAFVSRYFNGASWVPSAQAILSNGVTTNTDVTDGMAATVSYNVTGRAATWVADFTTGTIPPNFSVTRASQGYEVNSSGNLVMISTNTPRWDRDPDPASGHPIRGLLVEGALTNLLGSGAISEDVSLWDIDPGGNGYAQVSRDNSTSIPDLLGGTTAAWRLSDVNGGNASNVERALIQFTADIADNQEFVASVFIKKDTSRYAGLMLQSNGGMSAGVVVDLNTGTTAPMTGPYTPQEVLASGVVKYNNGWYRVWVKFNSHVATQGMFYLFPAFCDSAGALCQNGNIAAQGAVYVWGGQVEQGAGLTSYFPTNLATRAADDLIISLSNITSFSSAAGTFRAEFAQAGPTASKTLLFVGDVSNSIEIFGNAGSGDINGRLTSGSIDQGTALAPMPFTANSGPNAISFSYNTGSNVNLNIGLNGLGSTTGNITSVSPPTLSGLSLQVGGKSGMPATYLNGSIKSLHYWPNAFSIPGVKSCTH